MTSVYNPEDVAEEIRIINDAEGIATLIDYIEIFNDNNPNEPVALDFETTGLFPEARDGEPAGEVRLTVISLGDCTFIIDHIDVPFAKVATKLARAADKYYVFNAKFEGRWFDYFSSAQVNLFDIANMRKSVMGGSPLSLKMMIKWDFGIDISKDLQTSDWAAPKLTADQYKYAADDGIFTRDLAKYWSKRMTPAHWQGFMLLNDCWRAVVEAEDRGMWLDEIYHRRLIAMWERRRSVALCYIRKYIGNDAWANLNSKKQFSELLKKVMPSEMLEAWPKTEKSEQLKTDRNVLRGVSYRVSYPMSRILAAYMVYTRADYYLSHYGEKLITCQQLGDAVHANFNIAQAITGRFSSSGAVNLQNIPRNKTVRRSFIARDGHKIVLADYSGIELRVLAELSGDAQLKQDVIYGNVHAESAITLFRPPNPAEFMELVNAGDPWAKELRSKAKAFSFQLTYGAGPPALAVVLRTSDDEAREFIDRWAARYPKAFHFRTYMFEKMNAAGFLPCKSGREIYVYKKDRTLPVASNYPVQGSAADVMYAALSIVHRRLQQADLPIYVLATVHDELILEAADEYAHVAQVILEDGMKEAWLKVFPNTSTENLVEASIGESWAAK